MRSASERRRGSAGPFSFHNRRKDFIQDGLTVAKNTLDLSVYGGAKKLSNGTTGQCIMQYVLHQHTTIFFGESVQMVPETIGTKPLLVDEM